MDVFRTPDERFAEPARASPTSRTTSRSTACACTTSTRAAARPCSASTASRAGATSTGTCSTASWRAGTGSCARTYGGLRALGQAHRPATGTRTTATSRRVSGHLDQLDLEDVTVVVQDWGGPIGLRWAVENPDRVARLVILNTGLFTGRVSKGFMAWREFAERTPDLPIGMIIQGGDHDRPAARGRRRLRRAVPQPREQGRRAALPVARAHVRRRPRRGRDARRARRPERLGQAGAGRVLRHRPGASPSRGPASEFTELHAHAPASRCGSRARPTSSRRTAAWRSPTRCSRRSPGWHGYAAGRAGCFPEADLMAVEPDRDQMAEVATLAGADGDGPW